MMKPVIVWKFEIVLKSVLLRKLDTQDTVLVLIIKLTLVAKIKDSQQKKK